MKERPILFSGAMVRAILAGTKTQTRRVVKPQPKNDPAIHHPIEPYSNGRGRFNWVLAATGHGLGDPFPCPYGFAGDRLWVREAWSPDPTIDDSWASTQWSGCGRKVSEIPERFHHPRFCNYRTGWLHGEILWTPSIHMPRWASRITLEVTGARIERLQDISEADAIAEGIERRGPGWAWYSDRAAYTADPRTSYRDLWEQINGRDSWDANPWVWAIEFKRAA